MKFALVRRRTLWVPTWIGCLCMAAALLTAGCVWWYFGEAFLSKSVEVQPDVLVVEGWIGAKGVGEGIRIFKDRHFQTIVATGSLSGDRWASHRWDYAAESEEQMLRSKIPRDDVLYAGTGDTEAHRTFASAVATYRALEAAGKKPRSVTVYTRATHARRSRLVYQKVFGPGVDVGAVAWIPPGTAEDPWWTSSDRAKDMILETLGYCYEVLLNSGRVSNHPR